MRAQFITAADVAEIMGVSRSKAYQIVRDMNRELKGIGIHNGFWQVSGSILSEVLRDADWR